MADTPSRLSSGDIYHKGSYIPIEEFRNKIFARSLYSLDSEYQNTQLFSKNGQSNLASSISTVLNVIPQYNRMQVNTNLLGNVYDAFRDDGSPLAKIGLVMLGKQMMYNSAMNLSVKYLPSIDISQALKGKPEKMFKLNRDNTISVKDSESKSFLDKVGSVSSNILGIDTYSVFGDDNPFTDGFNSIKAIKNTGNMQLTRFFSAINMNLYKPINYDSNSDYSKTFVDYADEAGITIDSARYRVLAYQPSFTFDNARTYPYLGIKINTTAIGRANTAMDIAYSGNTNRIQEYAPTKDYILNNFGTTVKTEDKTMNNWVGDESNFSTDDDNNDKIVWGRDGLISESREYIGQFRGTDDNIATGGGNELNGEKFNVREGLLEYTRNLLNSTNGQFVDQTRKAFKRDNNIVGFQGSPLWETNNKKYSIDSGNELGKTGIRQHTAVDPYNRFAKSIRFKGNVVYNGDNNGNQNSVIYKTVLPRIHPTRKENFAKGENPINNKNLMFSLENLAVGTIVREKFGVIDDEYGTPIPLSEVGPFAGRLMWFPPYNIEINEVAIAKYESTVMVGRNEPMYNYMNSERTAVLSFSLLVDYPEQLRNKEYTGDGGMNKNKAIADFFAFGGNPLPSEAQTEIIEEKIEKLKDQLKEIGGPVDQAEPPDPKAPLTTIYFQNDTPTAGEVNTIIDIMYNNPNHYEIIDGMESAQDGNGFGLNKDIYYLENITGDTLTKTNLGVSGTSKQYTAISVESPFGPCVLNKNLLDVYSDEKFRKYYDIEITGTASKLYKSDNEIAYNKALGNRRVAAAKHLIISKLTEMFGATVANEIGDNNIKSKLDVGSTNGSAAGAESENMHLEDVKKERRADIVFKRNNLDVDKKGQELNQKQKEDIVNIQKDIQSLEFQLNVAKNSVRENIYNERNKAVLNSFESISGNQFYPVFHSQTPEDFHRRLTFLQQCTRQGAAKRYDIVDENTGELRARNSVFGKQPICVLRVGDFFYTKVVIESVTIDYADAPWDMNPEGFGMQPMMANITLQMKVIGGQSLQGPIDALQNAVTFNYYANSSFTDKEMYSRPATEANKQASYIKGVVTKKQRVATTAYMVNDVLTNKVTEGEE